MRSFGDRGDSRPALVCTYCGNHIVESGNVLWNTNSDGSGRVSNFVFAHKSCAEMDGGEQRFRSSMDIDVWLWKLVEMTRADLDGAVERYGQIDPTRPKSMSLTDRGSARQLGASARQSGADVSGSQRMTDATPNARNPASLQGSGFLGTAGVGFEPTDELPRQRFSRPPRSTAPAPRREP